jgi:head-tail adaptor
MLEAGLLQEMVVVEAAVESRNSLGETSLAWVQFAKRWAMVQAVSYHEQERRKQIGGMGSHTVRMRYVPGLTGKMRIRWASRGNRIMYISSVVEKGRREEHELTVDEQQT